MTQIDPLAVKKEGYLKGEKLKQLKELFFENNLSSYGASKKVGCSKNTAKNYFKKWAEELVNDDDHETWFEIEARVRKRIIEGLSNDIDTIQSRYNSLNELFNLAITEKDEIKIEMFGRMVRKEHEMLIQVKDRKDAYEMTPPNEEIFNQEMEVRIAETNGLRSKAVTE